MGSQSTEDRQAADREYLAERKVPKKHQMLAATGRIIPAYRTLSFRGVYDASMHRPPQSKRHVVRFLANADVRSVELEVIDAAGTPVNTAEDCIGAVRDVLAKCSCVDITLALHLNGGFIGCSINSKWA